MGKEGMKRKKKNQSQRHTPVESTQEAPHEPAGGGEQAQERSRQQAMASHSRDKATRTQLSAGQTKVQRLHKGNQPRGR